MEAMDLFDDLPADPEAAHTPIAPGAVLLRAFAHEGAADVLRAEETVTAQTGPSGCGWCMATWWCGAGPRAWRTTG